MELQFQLSFTGSLPDPLGYSALAMKYDLLLFIFPGALHLTLQEHRQNDLSVSCSILHKFFCYHDLYCQDYCNYNSALPFPISALSLFVSVSDWLSLSPPPYYTVIKQQHVFFGKRGGGGALLHGTGLITPSSKACSTCWHGLCDVCVSKNHLNVVETCVCMCVCVGVSVCVEPGLKSCYGKKKIQMT